MYTQVKRVGSVRNTSKGPVHTFLVDLQGSEEWVDIWGNALPEGGLSEGSTFSYVVQSERKGNFNPTLRDIVPHGGDSAPPCVPPPQRTDPTQPPEPSIPASSSYMPPSPPEVVATFVSKQDIIANQVAVKESGETLRALLSGPHQDAFFSPDGSLNFREIAATLYTLTLFMRNAIYEDDDGLRQLTVDHSITSGPIE